MTPAEALAAFTEQLAADEPLRTRLAAIADEPAFAVACVAAGAQAGLVFTAGDVNELLRQRRVFWLQRHIL